MKNDLIKEMDKVNYFNISEDEILNNDRIKAYRLICSIEKNVLLVYNI